VLIASGSLAEKARWQLGEGLAEAVAHVVGHADVAERGLEVSVLRRSREWGVRDAECEVKTLLQKYRLPQRLVKPVLDAYDPEPDASRFGVAAQSLTPEDRLELERAAGNYLPRGVRKLIGSERKEKRPWQGMKDEGTETRDAAADGRSNASGGRTPGIAMAHRRGRRRCSRSPSTAASRHHCSRPDRPATMGHHGRRVGADQRDHRCPGSGSPHVVSAPPPGDSEQPSLRWRGSSLRSTLILPVAVGGPGTGNGVVVGAGALVLGLAALALGMGRS
jgi:hypothetical protein